MIHNFNITRLLTAMLAALVLTAMTACSDDPDPKAARTGLVYMVATNDLGEDGLDTDDINEMKLGMYTLGRTDSRLLVFHASYYGKTRIIEITPDGNEKVLENMSTQTRPLDPAQMRSIMERVRQLAPASSYGLVFWSHGTGWLDDGSATAARPQNIRPLSYGDDLGTRMSIPDLAKGLEGSKFDFIYFDCCLMATVEVAYQLRHATPQIVASATELPREGMPYHKNVSCFLAPQADMAQAALNTYEYYISGQASLPYCTISVIETGALDELAEATADIMATGALPADSYSPVPYFRPQIGGGSYDMADYIRSLSIDKSLLDRWNRAFARTVTAAYATPKSYSLDMSRHTGLGTNIVTSQGLKSAGFGYTDLQWYKDVTSLHPVFN